MALPVAGALFCCAPPVLDATINPSASRLVQTALLFSMTAPSRLYCPADRPWNRGELASRAGRQHHIAGRVPVLIGRDTESPAPPSYGKRVRCLDRRPTAAADAIRSEFQSRIARRTHDFS